MRPSIWPATISLRPLGNGTLRITTRQEFQLHGVLKNDLASTIRQINEALLSTLAACGDVERNVLCCPAPLFDTVRDDLNADALALGVSLRSAVVSLLGNLARRREDRDPSSRRRCRWCRPPATTRSSRFTARPICRASSRRRSRCRKTIAPTFMPTTSVFWASSRPGGWSGYNVLVGGGLGTTPSAQKTFPFLALPLCYVDRGDVLKIGEAVLKVFRDFGNRSDRKRARLKYIIHDWGMPAFRAKVEEYLGHPLADPKPVEVSGVDDHLGWHSQGDGKLFLGIPVENGRIKDDGAFRLASGLRAFFQKYQTPARLTCQQKILLADLEPAWRGEIERWLAEYGIATVEQISTVRRWSMACPALPTCGLAVTEAERALPGILDQLEIELWRAGPGKRAVHRADDRLPQRLCPAL